MPKTTHFKEPDITPELIEEHGLSPEEYEHIRKILGRTPTFTELGIFSVMWSEHCSYKNSKRLLRTYPTEGECVLQGPGENAGVVDIGEGYAACFKMESHNHPSAVEPYQGATTGVGGILRDIFTMGARPVAMVDPLRFGDPSLPRNKYIVGGVISGIADYGNCVGIPTLAGDIYFSDKYNGNPLINVMSVGLMKKEDLTLACARSVGSYVVYYGNATGRDGIHGATFASEELSENSQEDRAVQVGDPFMGKKILEATLELIQSKSVEGIQDMGAAGLTCSSCEMAGKGGFGVEIDLDKVPQRAENLTPYEIMLSESQERMLAIVPQNKIDTAREILTRWDLDCVVLGQVTDDGLMRVKIGDTVVAEIPAAKISTEAPEYVRESKRPEYLDTIDQFDPDIHQPPEDYARVLLELLAHPTIADKRWVFEHYDHMVQTNSIVEPGDSAGVIRVKGTSRHIAVTCDCNGLLCYLDPLNGGRAAVAEAARNLVCAGAKPLAITNCLNFGNPMKPEIFYQFEKCIEGIGEACRELNTPVTGGNVSFYNENEGEAVFPTPVIGMLGLIEDKKYVTTSGFKDEGDEIVLIGPHATHLGGSHYFYGRENKIVGLCPEVDLAMEKKVQDFCLEMIRSGLVKSANDISEGGLVVCVAECCIRSKDGHGATISIDYAVRPDIELFSEEQSRMVISCPKDKADEIREKAESAGVPARKIGEVNENVLQIGSFLNASIDQLTAAYTTKPL